MAEAGSIVINLTTKTASFVEGVDKAGRSLHQFGRHAEESTSFLERFKEGLGIGAGVEAFRTGMELIEGPLEKIKQSFEDVGRIGRDALKLGIGAEEMSRLEHAANASHVEVGALETGIYRLNEAIGKVVSGDKGADAAANALQKLGLDARTLAELNPAETFQRVAGAVNGLHDSYQRAAVVQDLMGRGGKELIPIMKDLEGKLRESDQIGFTRTAEQLRIVEEQERKLAAVTDSLKGALMDLATSDFSAKLVDGFKSAAEGAKYLYDYITLNDVKRQNALMDRLNAQSPALDGKFKLDENATREEQIRLTKDRVEAERHLLDLERQVGAFQNDPAAIRDMIETETHTHRRLGEAQKLLSNLEEQAKGAAKVAEAERDAATAAAARADAEQRVWETAEKSLDAMEKQARQANMTRNQKELDDFARSGADDGQIAAFERAQKQRDAIGAVAKDAESAKRLWEQSETAAQKYNEKIKELDRMRAEGLLGDDKYLQMFERDTEEYKKAIATPDAPMPAHAERTRQASLLSRSFDFRVAGEHGDAQREVVNNQKQGLAVLNEWRPKIDQIWQSLTGTLVSAQADNVLDLTF